MSYQISDGLDPSDSSNVEKPQLNHHGLKLEDKKTKLKAEQGEEILLKSEDENEKKCTTNAFQNNVETINTATVNDVESTFVITPSSTTNGSTENLLLNSTTKDNNNKDQASLESSVLCASHNKKRGNDNLLLESNQQYSNSNENLQKEMEPKVTKDLDSHDTETCSEEEYTSDEMPVPAAVKEDKSSSSKRTPSPFQGILNISKGKTNNKTLVTGFTLHDGTNINIDQNFLQQPIVAELGTILDAFLNKVRVKPEFSGMIHKSDEKAKIAAAKEELIQNLTKNCLQLEKHNTQLRIHIKQVEEKLETHDQGAKRTIARMHKDFEVKLSELSKKCATAENEKQSSVMNFARREKELLDLRKQKEAADQLAKAATKEKEKAMGQLKQLKTELIKLKNFHERKENESSSQTKEIEKLKEEINSQAIKVRWAQNKLKSEVDSHKETKEKCEKMVLEIQQAKEETEQIRKNCQEMIKTYQESEEIKSNALDIEVKEKIQIISTQEEDLTKYKSLLNLKNTETNQFQTKLTNLTEENQNLKTQLEALNQERNKNQSLLREYEETLNKQKATATQMNEKMQDIFNLQEKIEHLNETIGNLNDALHEAVLRRDAALNDVACKQKKEQELLEFTEKVSSKNTQLTVEKEELNSKLKSQNDLISSQTETVQSLEKQVQELTTAKVEQNQATMKSQTTMNNRLEEKERTICQLLLQLEELKDEMRTVKRKNAASLKDLTRQLNQVKRKAENTDALSTSSMPNSGSHSGDGGSMGSRASSTTSLDKINYPPDNHGHSNSQNCEHISVPETAITGPDSLDRQMLIERIVRLQQIHAKKNEKIDFLNEHIHQLVSALQKKQRLIQHYIMREESGALAPPREHHDPKRHGLTLDLSMEMNQKMQSVLEDTLLKNITLKESLETLGQEVQRLSATSQAKPS